MPSGYTSKLHDGPQSFRDFALCCARGMGAAIHQRDDGDGEITLRTLDRYYHERVANAEAELAEARSWTDDQWTERQDAALAKDALARQERAIEQEAMRLRYVDMIACVNEWEPPTAEHEGLKELMREQLQQSMDFDCSGRLRPTKWHLPIPAYRSKELAKLAEGLARAHKHLADEQERIESQNAWVTALRDSLPAATREDTTND